MPILLSGTQVYGTLCAIDPAPQRLTQQDARLLVILARIIATQLERDAEFAARQRAEQERNRLYREVQAALRERDAFLSIASHELKTPLAALLGYTQLLQRRGEREGSLGEREREALQVIVGQGERLNAMIGTLLDISRIEQNSLALELEVVDLQPLLHQVVVEQEPLLERHALSVHDAPAPLIVCGDSLRLAQVFRNLLSNAVKYSPQGGTIWVTLGQEAGQATVAIRDQGIGIPESAMPELFARFYRAPNGQQHAIRGFGIGLYLVREIVTRHGGSVSVSSVEGVGSTFVVRLPLHEEVATLPPSLPA